MAIKKMIKVVPSKSNTCMNKKKRKKACQNLPTKGNKACQRLKELENGMLEILKLKKIGMPKQENS